MKPKKRIFVVKLGWVFIGEETARTTSVIHVADAAVVRRWGTTRGLGELAIHGPTKDTLLDEAGTLEIQLSSLLFSIDCAV